MFDLVFRPQCAGCGVPAQTFCEDCACSLVELRSACRRCAEPVGEDAQLCGRCARAPLPLERIVAPWRYGGQLATAIRRLKLHGRTHVARDLAPLWAPLVAAAADDAIAPSIVVPVPLHWRRRLVRGYDHTWLLATHACAAARIAAPVPALRRIRGGPPQRSLDRDARRDNPRDAFVARTPIDGAVVLVDDVVTTGATLAACARALYAAGATRVVGVALARATSSP